MGKSVNTVCDKLLASSILTEDQDTAVGWGGAVYLLAQSNNGIGFTDHGPALADLGTQAAVFVLQDFVFEAVCNY